MDRLCSSVNIFKGSGSQNFSKKEGNKLGWIEVFILFYQSNDIITFGF
jgi:hypothetical protein